MNQKAVTLYANSLSKLSKSDEEFTDWVNRLKGLKEIIDTKPEVKAILSSPVIKIENKMDLLKKILNGDWNSIISQFLFVLLEKRRWNLLDGIMLHLNEEIKKRSSILEFEVFAKEPLTPDTKENITKQLETKYKKKVFLHEKIDPSLIGGAVILGNSSMIDCSMIGRLDQMKIDLKDRV